MNGDEIKDIEEVLKALIPKHAIMHFHDQSMIMKVGNIITGGTHYHYSNEKETKDDKPSLTHSEVKIKDALIETLEATDENGKKIFTEKRQWYAVYRVLSDYCGYPKNMKEFADLMCNLDLDDNYPECIYNAFRRVPTETTKLGNKLALWHNYRNSADERTRRQIAVAMKLMELLEIAP